MSASFNLRLPFTENREAILFNAIATQVRRLAASAHLHEGIHISIPRRFESVDAKMRQINADFENNAGGAAGGGENVAAFNSDARDASFPHESESRKRVKMEGAGENNGAEGSQLATAPASSSSTLSEDDSFIDDSEEEDREEMEDPSQKRVSSCFIPLFIHLFIQSFIQSFHRSFSLQFLFFLSFLFIIIHFISLLQAIRFPPRYNHSNGARGLKRGLDEIQRKYTGRRDDDDVRFSPATERAVRRDVDQVIYDVHKTQDLRSKIHHRRSSSSSSLYRAYHRPNVSPFMRGYNAVGGGGAAGSSDNAERRLVTRTLSSSSSKSNKQPRQRGAAAGEVKKRANIYCIYKNIYCIINCMQIILLKMHA